MTRLLFLFIGSFASSGFAQESGYEQEKKNLITVALGYTYLPKGAAPDAHEADGVFTPSIGLEYFRRVHSWWGIAPENFFDDKESIDTFS